MKGQPATAATSRLGTDQFRHDPPLSIITSAAPPITGTSTDLPGKVGQRFSPKARRLKPFGPWRLGSPTLSLFAVAIVCLLGSSPCALGQTNASMAAVRALYFLDALATNPPAGLPRQGPWQVSTNDLKWPMKTIDALVEHKLPWHALLWQRLSSETRRQLGDVYVKVRAPKTFYVRGPEIDALVSELNALMQTNMLSLLDQLAEWQPAVSGDTFWLLTRAPSGADSTRLNRLILEDLYRDDLFHRPKILMDTATKSALFIDFRKNTITLYSTTGKKQWSSDLTPPEEERLTAEDPSEITDVSFRQEGIVVSEGRTTILVDRKSGRVINKGSL